MSARDPTLRFSDRVEDYERYRPTYPAEVIDVLAEMTRLEPPWTVVDVGSGTGLSTVPFLARGHEVWAVEPNPEMRAAAERLLGGRSGFHSVEGTAEATGLDAGSMDLAVAAQAFHWFRTRETRVELRRVLRAPGWVALLWNTRRTRGTPFLEGYEALLERHGTDYGEVRHDRRQESVSEFFAAGHDRRVLPNEQLLDRTGLRGRVTSSSYVPPPGDPGHEPMLEALDALFEEHAEDGLVRLTYDCEILVGRLAGP